MNGIIASIAEGVKEISKSTLETITEFPKWYNEKNSLKNIDNFQKADKPFYKISEEMQNNIKEISPYNEKINDYLRTPEELKVYMKNELRELQIGDKTCLLNDNIEWKMKDDFGNTNIERLKKGRAPIGKDGKPIELHHIGQKADSPLAELPSKEHRSNYSELHSKQESEINRSEFAKERANHWKERANIIGEKYV